MNADLLLQQAASIIPERIVKTGEAMQQRHPWIG